MALVLRSIEERDIPAMAAIRALEWETQSYWQDRISGFLSGEHSPQQALPERAIFVALDGDGNELIGFVAGLRTRRFGCDGELEWINVTPAKRGQGIAGRLMAKMGVWFVEQEAFRVCVNVAPENLAACKLYASCGAQPLNEYWMVWPDSRTMAL